MAGRRWRFLRRVAAGDSPYVAHARASMGFTGEKMDKQSDLYKLAKARILGLGYQCGWEKFITMAWDLARYDVTQDDPEWIDEEQPFTDKVIRFPGMVRPANGWSRNFGIRIPGSPGCGGGWRTPSAFGWRPVCGNLPSGRQMRYEDVRASMKLEKDPKTGEARV